MSIKLFIESTSGPSQDFSESKTNLRSEGVFKKAEVILGTWIFYTYSDYNDKQNGANSDCVKVLKPGDVADISAVNGSMYEVKDALKGVILFEHWYYGGRRVWYEEYCSDVNNMFPANTGGGVSSAIVVGRNESFNIYGKPDYKGMHNALQAGKWYDTPASMNFPNDKVQSVRKA